jgi:hypothetical protein
MIGKCTLMPQETEKIDQKSNDKNRESMESNND